MTPYVIFDIYVFVSGIRHLLLELDEDAMICEKGNRIPSVSGDSIDGEQQAENISNGEHEASFQDDLAVRRLEGQSKRLRGQSLTSILLAHVEVVPLSLGQ